MRKELIKVTCTDLRGVLQHLGVFSNEANTEAGLVDFRWTPAVRIGRISQHRTLQAVVVVSWSGNSQVLRLRMRHGHGSVDLAATPKRSSVGKTGKVSSYVLRHNDFCSASVSF